ncbi:unnamed protein product, partial [Rotaria sp. Silwood2]
MHNDFYRITTAEDSNSTTTQSQDLHEIFNILLDGIETLNNDRRRLSNESLAIQNSFLAFRQELYKFKSSIEILKVLLQDIEQNQCTINRIFASLQETINNAQTVSHDGTFVWKITNVKDKIMDAKTLRETSICSAPFFSSPTGYKMRALLYLNGHGHARGIY